MHVPIYVFIMHCTVFPVRSALHSQEASKVRSISINITSAAGFLQYLMAAYMPCALSRFVSSIVMADLGSWRVVPATNQRRDLDAWTIPPDPKVSEIQRYWKSEKKNTLKTFSKQNTKWPWKGKGIRTDQLIMKIHHADPCRYIVEIHTHPYTSIHIHADPRSKCKEMQRAKNRCQHSWQQVNANANPGIKHAGRKM